MKVKKKTNEKILLGIILAGIFVMSSYYLSQKSGYFIDEGMTLFLSNAHYNGAVTSKSEYDFGDFLSTFVWRDTLTETIKNVCGMLKEVRSAGNYSGISSSGGTVTWYDAGRKLLQGESTWISGEELYEQIIVKRNERFQYAQVYLNQMVDVHPPLYYMIVHTIFSVFCETYSDSYLFGINIFFLLGTCVLLFAIISWGGEECTYLTVILFGFSQGFFSCVLYFRMYAMLTFSIMLTLYIHLYMKKKNWIFHKRDSLLLILTVLFGFLTQYYYILYLLPLFVVVSINMLTHGQKKEFWKYFKNMFCAGVIGLAVWSFSVYHIFFGYRGTEVISTLKDLGSIGNRFLEYGRIFCKSFFFGCPMIVVFLLLVLSTILLLYRVIQKKKSDMEQNITLESNWSEIIIPAVVGLVFVIIVTPGDAKIRYVMCFFPFIMMFVAFIITNIVNLFVKRKEIIKMMLALIGCIYIFCTVAFTTPDYMYPEQKEYQLGLIDKKRKDLNCLMVGDYHKWGFPEVQKLSLFNQVMVIGEKELEMLRKNQPDNITMGIVVYIWNGLNQESMLQNIAQALSSESKTIQEISSDIADFHAYILE